MTKPKRFQLYTALASVFILIVFLEPFYDATRILFCGVPGRIRSYWQEHHPSHPIWMPPGENQENEILSKLPEFLNGADVILLVNNEELVPLLGLNEAGLCLETCSDAISMKGVRILFDGVNLKNHIKTDTKGVDYIPFSTLSSDGRGRRYPHQKEEVLIFRRMILYSSNILPASPKIVSNIESLIASHQVNRSNAK